MTLADVVYGMVQRGMTSAQLTDLEIGTVVNVSPLEISTRPDMAPLQEKQLLRTSAVVEKKIPVLAHSHQTSGMVHSHTVSGLVHSHTLNGTGTSTDLSGAYPTDKTLSGSFSSDQQLSDIACIEDGETLPVVDGYIVINRGLSKGDRVLLLRVEHGSRAIILSRVY